MAEDEEDFEKIKQFVLSVVPVHGIWVSESASAEFKALAEELGYRRITEAPALLSDENYLRGIQVVVGWLDARQYMHGNPTWTIDWQQQKVDWGIKPNTTP